MVKTLRRLVLGFCVVFAAAGCSAPQPPESPPRVAPLVLPSPSGTPLTVQQAALQYAEIVQRRNAAIKEFYDTGDSGGGDWLAERQQVADLLAATEVEAVRLAQTPWPSQVRPLVDQLVGFLVHLRQALSDAAHATTEEQFLDRVGFVTAGDASCAFADQIRARLGLPRLEDCYAPVPVGSASAG